MGLNRNNHDEFAQLNNMQILDLRLDALEDCPTLYITSLVDNQMYSMTFTNVSSITISNFSLPFQIQGFEISSNKDKGWEKTSSYSIYDYEDDKIRFHCEDIQIQRIS